MTVDCSKVNIKNGSTGETVKEVQKYLTYYKYYDGKIDGICGNYTVEAIKKWQKYKGLKVDGNFGPLSCKTSYINGTDISSSTKELSLSVFKDMLQRYTNYVKTKAKEPNIIYIDINYPYEYVSLKQFSDMNRRYTEYTKNNGNEPKTIQINKSTSSNTSSTTNINTNTTNNNNQTVFTSSPHYESTGCNRMGQCTGYWCACVSFCQILKKFGITKYPQKTIAGYMGTTTAGTGHTGIETGIAKIAKLEGITLKVEWKDFSDLGSTAKERYKALGQLMSASNKGVIIHDLYRNKFGHYETLKSINLNNSNMVVLNSLGSKCNSPAYCGYLETRTMSNMSSYISGISQKSICIITKV